MILTSMLFLLGLSSDIIERKMILTFRQCLLCFFTVTSRSILLNSSIIMIKTLTGGSLVFLFFVIFLVITEVVIFDNKISKYIEDMIHGNNNNDTNSINNNNNLDNISKITNNIISVKLLNYTI
jgi:hypothetical protein